MRIRMIRSVVAVLPILATLSYAALAQKGAADEDQPIRLKTDLVELRAVVTDKKGQLVDNLKREDFEIFDKGKNQNISFFSIARIGGGTATVGARDRTSTEGSRRLSAEVLAGRNVVLFVDNLHLSVSSIQRVKQQLNRFIDERLTDDDSVGIATTAGSLGALQQFVRDRKILKSAVARIAVFPRSDSLFTPYLASRVTAEDEQALAAAAQVVAAEEGSFPRIDYVRAKARQFIAEETNLRRATLLTLKGACETLTGLPGQRMVVFISDGFTLYEERGNPDYSDVRAATGRAARSGVVIYSLNPRGLTPPAVFGASHRSALDLSGIVSQYVSNSESDDQNALRTLASETGGESFLNTNDFAGALGQVLDRNSLYYELAFYPERENDNRKFRNINVRVKNHPDYTVRAQKGYIPAETEKAEEPKTPRQKLFRAMLASLPTTDIRITSSADFVESEADDAQATLQVHVSGDSLQYQRKEEQHLFKCEIAVVVYDQHGKLADSFIQAMGGALSADPLEQAKRSGYGYLRRLRLRPGLYNVRVGVRDTESGRMGTSASWLEVADLRKGKLALSGLFLGRGKTGEDGQPVESSNRRSVSPKLIFGSASFKTGDLLFYRLAAYNASSSAVSESGPTIKVEILKGEKSVYEGAWQPLQSRLLRTDKKGLELGGTINLGLDPGFYQLRVTVNDVKSKKPEQRVVWFEIES